MKKLKLWALCAGVALPVAAVACSKAEKPAEAPQAGTPAYWESNAPAAEPRVEDRSDTKREQALPPGGDVFRERSHAPGTTDKFLWQDSPLPEPTDGAQSPSKRPLEADAGAP